MLTGRPHSTTADDRILHNRSGAMMDAFGSSLDELMSLTPEQQAFADDSDSEEPLQINSTCSKTSIFPAIHMEDLLKDDELWDQPLQLDASQLEEIRQYFDNGYFEGKPVIVPPSLANALIEKAKEVVETRLERLESKIDVLETRINTQKSEKVQEREVLRTTPSEAQIQEMMQVFNKMSVIPELPEHFSALCQEIQVKPESIMMHARNECIVNAMKTIFEKKPRSGEGKIEPDVALLEELLSEAPQKKKSKKKKQKRIDFLEHVEEFERLNGDTLTALTAAEAEPLYFHLNDLPEGIENEPSSSLVGRLKNLHALFNTREEHFRATLQRHQLATQLTKTRSAQLAMSMHKLSERVQQAEAHQATQHHTEDQLRAQLRLYVEKFRQVEQTLARSNELFGTFRKEMEQMSTKLNNLERDNVNLVSKNATLSRNIIDMVDERTKQAATIEQLTQQKARLANLCRSMQHERNIALGRDSKGEKSVREGSTPTTLDPK